MSTTIRDIDASRKITIDATNLKNPYSVFVEMPNGTCLEFDRGIFENALRQAFPHLIRMSTKLADELDCPTLPILRRTA